MRFISILIATTVITLIAIFSFYKVFLAKPSASQTPKTSQTSQTQPLPSVQTLPQASLIPSNPPKKTSSPAPKASLKPATIGTLTVIQSAASPTSSIQTSVISGTIDFTGSAPSGSSIVIVARKNGSTDSFKTVVDGVSAQNSASWSWASAENGVAYDMIAVLKGQSNSVNIDYAASPTYTVTAPAKLQVFSVNVGYPLSTPTGTITITCTTHNSNNTWYATVNYPAVTGALMYHLQVGTTSGTSDLVNSTKNAQTAAVTLTDSVNYYAQYAVASVSNPTSAQYSSFSTPTTVKCP